MDTERDQFVADAVDSLRGVSALRAAQGFLRRHTAGSGRSWPEIQARLSEYLDVDFIDREDVIELITGLRSRSHKYISIYPLSATERQHALNFSADNEASGPWAARFPFLIPPDSLSELGPDPVHVATQESPAGIALFFTAARIGKRTDEIPIDDIVADARGNYVGVDKMYAERIERRQAFDVVFIPRGEGALQVRVDSFATTGRERTDSARDAVEKKLSELGILARSSSSCVNLFPVIQSIYNDENEGSLTGLMFECSSGANRRELLRKGSATSDLRQEAYHAAGVTRTEIVAYWLSVLLKTPSSEIEIALPGTVRGLQHDLPLYAFEVTEAADEEALASAVDILLHHAKNG